MFNSYISLGGKQKQKTKPNKQILKIIKKKNKKHLIFQVKLRYVEDIASDQQGHEVNIGLGQGCF